MFQDSYMRYLVIVIGIVAVIALGAYTYSTIKQAHYMYSGPTSISVVGEGEVFATPDIATFSFTVEAKETDAVTAQTKSAETMSSVLAYLKSVGIEERDIKTQYYNLYPRYEYPNVVCTQWSCPPMGEPTIIGYEVSQSVSVKVRDTGKAGEIISGVGSRGALNVSGLSFTIDDEDELMAEARKQAIEDAKEKAEVLAKNLGARIVRMNGYWEDQGGGYPTPYYGMGGKDMMVMSEAEMGRSAELPLGENTITARVNISYEIK